MLQNLMKKCLQRNSLFLIITVFLSFSCAQTKDNNHSKVNETKVLPEYIFSPTTALASQVEQTLKSAKAQNKQALFVLGTQWCHDSKGLAKQFSTPQMQKILTNNYQVLFVDVGYLEKGFELVKQFGLPVYYGTPTVLVIEPNSEKILNRASMQKWLNAAKVPLNEYEAYFTKFAENKHFETAENSAMKKYLNEIKQFEQQQALRLKAAYQVIGPLLKQYMESDDKKAPDEFSNKWQQVHDLRYRIQDDIQTLMTQAKSNVSAGSSSPLMLPIYPAFTWE